MQNRPRVVLTHKIPEKGLNLLRDDFEVIILDPSKSIPEQLKEQLPSAHYLVPLLSVEIGHDLIKNSSNLKGIANYAVGYNNIDIRSAKEYGILVTNTPDVLTNATADLTWGLILAVTRRIIEAERECRNPEFQEWAPEFMLGYELSGKTLGILGMGRIGRAVAQRGIGFGMEICYYSRSAVKTLPKTKNMQYISNLTEFLQLSDIISLHVPYTAETHHLIGEKELKLMKSTSFLINTARGKVIDEIALIKALRNKDIAGSGLDVFYDEPKVPRGLRDLNNVVMTPHIGSATREARDAMSVMVAENIHAMEKGLIPPNLVQEMKKERE